MIEFHILITDDDDKIRSLLKSFLENKNFLVTTASDASEAKQLIEIITFDLLIIDIMMPGINGFDLTKEIRNTSNIPIIHLTAMNEKKDIIYGLETGADDYIAKPFEPRELELRIRNILNKKSTKAKKNTLQLNNILLDLRSGTIKGINQDLSLSGNEIKILEILSSKPGEPFQRDYLINALGFNQERTLDVCINRLRKKIEKNPKVPKYLKTKRGSGYVLWID